MIKKMVKIVWIYKNKIENRTGRDLLLTLDVLKHRPNNIKPFCLVYANDNLINSK